MLSDARRYGCGAGHIAVDGGGERAMVVGGADAAALGADVDDASAVEPGAVAAVVSAGTANRPSLDALPSSFVLTRAC